MEHLNIGDAAAAAGVTPKMIRHYESLGLIPDVQRTEAGYRLYSPREVGMLRFIRQSRTLGFSVKQIEMLLGFWRDDHRASREVKELAQKQLQELAERKREIDEMTATLSDLVARCAGDDQPHCAIIETLATSPPPVEPAPARTASKSLKQVRAGSTGTPRKKNVEQKQPRHEHAPHSGLMAWTRSVARGE